MLEARHFVEKSIVAAGALRAAFHDVARHDRAGQPVPVVSLPAEMPGRRAHNDRRVGDARADDDVRTAPIPDEIANDDELEGIYLDQLVGRDEVKFDLRKFVWIGSPVSEPMLFYMRADTPYKSISDIRNAKEPPKCGSTGTVSTDFILARMLEDLKLSLDRAILVEVSDTEIRKRLVGRAELEHRSDDSDDVIAHRLEVFRKQTAPLVEYYERRGLLTRLNGERSIDVVFDEMEKLAAA